MSFQKDIIEAEVRTAGAHKVQADLGKVNKRIAELAATNKRLKYEMAKLEAQGKKNSPAWKELNNQHKINNKLLTIQRGKLEELNSKLKLTEMSKRQLRKRSIELGAALSGTSKKLEPEKWNKLNKQLIATEKQLDKVKHGSKSSMSVLTGLKRVAVNILPAAGIATFVGWIKTAGVEIFNLSKTIQGEAIRSTTVLGDQLGYVEGQAEGLAEKMGVTNREFVSMVANTADLLVPLDFTRKKAADMASQVQGLAGALDEWTAGKLGVSEVSNILTKAMLGEMEQLKQLGIAIKMDSEEYRNLVKQKMAEEGATKAQAQALATLDLLYKKSADAQTAYQKKGNQLIRLQKSISLWWRQLKEDVANYLITSSSDRLLKQVDDLQKIEKQFANEKKTLSSLLGTYDTLKTKGNLTKEEQIQLNSAIRDIGNIVPTAITEFNKYGDAIGINKDKIKEAREAQRLLNLEMKEEVIDNLIDGIDDYVMDIERANGQIKARNELLTDETKMQTVINNTGMERSKIENNNLKAIRDQQGVIKEKNTELAKTLLKLKDIGLTEAEISNKTGLSLEKMNGIVKNYLASINSSTNPPPVVTTTKSLIKELENQLALAKEMPESTEKEIASKNLYIKTIEDEIKRLKELGTIKIKPFKDDGSDDKEFEAQMDREIAAYLKAQEQLAAIRKQYGLEKDGEKYNEALRQLEDYHNRELISEEEYQLAKKAIKDAYKEASTIEELEADILEAETDEAKWQAQFNLTKERYDQEFKAANGNRLKELQAKRKYEDDVKKIENDRLRAKVAIKEAELDLAMNGLATLRTIVGEETALGKMLFVAEQAMAIGRVWFHTGIANAKAVAAMPLTAGQPWVGINTASAVLQTAKIAAQTIQGFEEGGFTKVRRAQDNKEFRARFQAKRRGFIDKPTVIVGEKDPEFVANGAAVKNPTVKPYLDVIDAAQRAGTIETLNLPAVTSSMVAEGREQGGYTPSETTPEPSDSTDDNSIISILQQSTATTQELNTILKKGIRAVLIYKELEEMEEEVETIKNAANL